MPNIRVGYRRAYIAPACSIEGGDCLDFDYFYRDVAVEVHIAREPRFVIPKSHAPHIAVADRELPINSTAEAWAYLHISDSLVTEIICHKEIVISDEEYQALTGNEEDFEQQFNTLTKLNLVQFKIAADFVAGAISIGSNLQFTTETINVSVFIDVEDWRRHSVSNTLIRIVDPVVLTASNVEGITSLLTINNPDPDTVDRIALATGWLLRAWAESQPVLRFLSLFIPLEIIVKPYGAEPENENVELQEKIIEFINASYSENKERKRAIGRFKGMLKPPPLSSRFRALAKLVNIEGWEEDVEKFDRFNKLRNALVHKGESYVSTDVNIETEATGLSDLVEHYIRWVFENIDHQ